MHGNHAEERSMHQECSAHEPFYEEVYIDGFGNITLCRFCGNAIEVGHASTCPVCKRKQY